LRDLKAGNAALPGRVLNGILALSEFLVSEARILETGSDQVKKEAKEQIPNDRVKDGPAVARELRWRVKLALGYTSEDEDIGGSRKGKNLIGSKRKAQDVREEGSHFRNFKPKIWDAERVVEQHESSRMGKRPKPEGTDWAKAWLEADVADTQSVDVPVKVRGETIVRVRRTATGTEEQRISREVEEWTFSD
jgi:F-box/leucine-rich repeat protein 10/11